MTNEKNEQKSNTTTTVTQDAPAADMEMLSAEEEHVVRMRHGLGEGDEHALKFGLGASNETMAKLANLEKFLVDKFAQDRKIEGVFEDDVAEIEAESVTVQAHRRADD